MPVPFVTQQRGKELTIIMRLITGREMSLVLHYQPNHNSNDVRFDIFVSQHLHILRLSDIAFQADFRLGSKLGLGLGIVSGQGLKCRML